jgi:hypothetical protein
VSVSAGTESNPVTGTVTRNAVPISDVEHWRDGDVFFIRSTEFDCYAEDEDFDTAVGRFGETAEDLALYLASLVRSGEATANERAVFDLLGPRLMEAYRRELAEVQVSRNRFISIRIGGRRRGGRGVGAHWAPRTTPSNSSQPSPA